MVWEMRKTDGSDLSDSSIRRLDGLSNTLNELSVAMATLSTDVKYLPNEKTVRAIVDSALGNALEIHIEHCSLQRQVAESKKQSEENTSVIKRNSELPDSSSSFLLGNKIKGLIAFGIAAGSAIAGFFLGK